MTNRITRRELLALTGASMVSSPLAAQQAAQRQENRPTGAPDLIVLNARVVTVDPRQPRAQAFAFKNGRFLAVGSSADIRNMIRAGAATWDAKGAAIVPGFIDTHNHAPGTTLLYEVLVGNPFEVSRLDDGASAAISTHHMSCLAIQIRSHWVTSSVPPSS